MHYIDFSPLPRSPPAPLSSSQLEKRHPYASILLGCSRSVSASNLYSDLASKFSSTEGSTGPLLTISSPYRGEGAFSTSIPFLYCTPTIERIVPIASTATTPSSSFRLLPGLSPCCWPTRGERTFGIPSVPEKHKPVNKNGDFFARTTSKQGECFCCH